MLESHCRNRRALLRLMGPALFAASLSLKLPSQLLAMARQRVPDPLRLIASRETCRHARRRVQLRGCDRPAVQAAHAYLHAPENPVARAHYERQAREDFVAGRVAVVRGWVVAETELALLSMIER